MKMLLSNVAFILAIVSIAGYARESSSGFTAQPKEMNTCGPAASEKDPRSRQAAFLRDCPKSAAAWARIKTCNQEANAKALKGREREAFMGQCWRGQRQD